MAETPKPNWRKADLLVYQPFTEVAFERVPKVDGVQEVSFDEMLSLNLCGDATFSFYIEVVDPAIWKPEVIPGLIILDSLNNIYLASGTFTALAALLLDPNVVYIAR